MDQNLLRWSLKQRISDKFKSQKFSKKRFKIIDRINNNCYLAKMYQTNDNTVLCRYFEKPKPQQIQQKKKLEIIMKQTKHKQA